MPYPPVPKDVIQPSDSELIDMLTAAVMETENSFPTSCPDACEVEPDGQCQHGHPSWLRRARLI